MARKKRKADPAQSAAATATATVTATTVTNHQQELPSSELKPRYVHITDDRPKRAAKAAAAEEEDGEDFTKLLESLNREQLVALVRVAAEASPAAMAAVRRAAESDPASRKLFVHGLDKRAGAQDLRSAFSRFGEVEDCRVVTDRHSGNNCKGYGFVLFLTRGAALRALRDPRIQIGGRPAFCKLAAFGPAPPSLQSQNPPSSSANASSVTSNNAPASSSSSQPDNMQRKIFIGNVHAEVDVDRLHGYFSQFGEIEEGPLMGFDKSTGQPTGFALFVYKSRESARRALEAPMQNFDGKVLNVQATDGITNSTPGSNSNANSSATAASAQMNESSISAINPYDPSTNGATDVHDQGFAQQAAMPGMGAFAQPNIAMLAMMAAVMQNPAMLAALNPAFAAMGAGGQHTGIPGFGAQGFGTQGPSPGGGHTGIPGFGAQGFGTQGPSPGGGHTGIPGFGAQGFGTQGPSPGGGHTGIPGFGAQGFGTQGPSPGGGHTGIPGFGAQGFGTQGPSPGGGHTGIPGFGAQGFGTQGPPPGGGDTGIPGFGAQGFGTQGPSPGGGHTGIPGFGAQGFGTQGPSPGGGSMASPAPLPGGGSMASPAPLPGGGSMASPTPLPGGGSTTAPWPSPSGGSTRAPMPGEASTTVPGPSPVGGSTTAPGPCLGGGFAAGGVDFPSAAGLQKVAAYQGGLPGFQGTPGFPTSGFQVGQSDSQTGTTATAAGATSYQAGAAGQDQVPSSQTGY